jgi:hypothetical protein
MLEAPEVEAHLHHKTGHSLADKILAVLAVFLSCVSVFIAVSHGRTMERLVAANSWPNLTYDTGNVGDDPNHPEISFDLRNTGVGPARIDSFEVFYKGVPQASADDLLKSCCGSSGNRSISRVIDEVLPSRDVIEFLSFPRDGNDAALWSRLDQERFGVRVRACYCSVFEECWVRDTAQRRPTRVDECKPSQPVQFKTSFDK